jgi:hypothetical protein
VGKSAEKRALTREINKNYPEKQFSALFRARAHGNVPEKPRCILRP